MIELKKIVLEGITKKEYDNMYIWWEGYIFGYEKGAYSKVTNPICFEIDDTNKDSRVKSYHSAVLELLKHQYVSCLSVNNKGRWWIRVSKSEEGKYQLFDFIAKGNEKPSIDTKLNDINQIDFDHEIFKIAEIAAMDRFHHAYMEIRIGYKQFPKNRTWIGFIEYETQDGKRIIGYQVNLRSKYRGFFNVKNETSKGYRWNHGLWVPENYKDLPSPAEMRGKKVQ